MPDRTPTGDLRAQLRRVLHAYDTDIDARAAAAVLPVVEAETAALRQRIEEADDRAEAAGYEATSARLDLREAERQLQQALDQIATERRGRLAAEAAARRGREIHRRHDCARHVNPRTPVPCANHGLCEGCGAPWPCRTFTALDAEGRQDEALDLLREFVHDTPCDPHPGNGFCQTHAHRPPCPHAAAKELLAAEQPSRAECGDYDPAVAMTNPMTAPPAEYLDAEQPKETP